MLSILSVLFAILVAIRPDLLQRLQPANRNSASAERTAKEHYQAGVAMFNAGRLAEAIDELNVVLSMPADSLDAGYVNTARNIIGKAYLRMSPPRCDKAHEQIRELAGIDGSEFSQEIERLLHEAGCK